jgi:hypothetical protein
MSSSHPSAGGNNSNNAPLVVVDNSGGVGGGNHAPAAGAAAAAHNNNNGGGGTPLRNNTTTNKPPSLSVIKKDTENKSNIFHQIVRLISQKRPHVIVGQSKPEKDEKRDVMRQIYKALWDKDTGTLRGYPYWTEKGEPAHKKLFPRLMEVVEYLATSENNDAPTDVKVVAAEIIAERSAAVSSNADHIQARADAQADLQQRNVNAQGVMGLNATRGVTLPSNIAPSDVGITQHQMSVAAGALGGRTGVSSIGPGAMGLGLATNVSANAGAAAARARARGARSPFCE